MPFLLRFLNGVCMVAMLLAVAPRTAYGRPHDAQRPDQASVSGTILDATGAGVPHSEVDWIQQFVAKHLMHRVPAPASREDR